MCPVKAVGTTAMKTDDSTAVVGGETGEITKSESDKKKQRRWSEVPDAGSVPKVGVYCM